MPPLSINRKPSSSPGRWLAVAILLGLLFSGWNSWADSTARTVLLRHVPCDLFSTGEPVVFDYKIKIDPVDAPNEVITPTDPSTWSKLELQ